ncbi:protein KINESIN LIGHT CHAIN-RELATED 1-like [Impatiens glandulifera]|uniref:protein KINESIN LIGHT CHAIN-RELATED 1-like n=1 Tax=Impatiens glandulifera TaxID=253017 RepID=UPI001FB126E2|nr:protein KINESIN LIGHT CHAIN-RELATED 1-like [Impatiens glandulifera]
MMRRVSSKSLSISRHFIASTASIEPNTNRSIAPLFKTNNNHALFSSKINILHLFSTATSNSTPAEKSSESIKTAEDMLRSVKNMEAGFGETELGLACLNVGIKLDQDGENPEKIFPYACRALDVFDKDSNPSLYLAMTLQLLGSVSYNLNKFDDSLVYLHRAENVLVKLEKENSSSLDEIRPILCNLLVDLAKTKTAMGRREEAIINLRKCLEIKETALGKDNKELGDDNMELAQAYNAVLNFDEALPFCLKALDIHKAQFGHDSIEVADARRVLGEIYTGLEQHEKALEEIVSAKLLLKSLGLDSDMLRAEIASANTLIALGRFQEAVDTLKSVAKCTDKESDDRAIVYVSMAKALFHLDKLDDSKKCLEIARLILDEKNAIPSEEAVEAYMEISMQYETMGELDSSVLLLKKTLELIVNLPELQHLEGSISARIGWLHLSIGQAEKAVVYLENATERLKINFGSNHFGVGYVYNNLGSAYMDLDKPQLAADSFIQAKKIMEVSLGRVHEDTIGTCRNLVKAYEAMKSYSLAIELQEQVIEDWKTHGLSTEDDELKEANLFLEQLKKGALNQ